MVGLFVAGIASVAGSVGPLVPIDVTGPGGRSFSLLGLVDSDLTAAP